jgi:sigma-B regulation protein RsbU (phosphoserine phosphatase)
MIRAVIVDDEAPARARLRLLLEGRGVDIVGEAVDGEQALECIEGLAPDLVFLDIQMPGLSGLEVAARLSAPRPRLLFCTAFDEFALAAFEHQAVDYLLKPVNRDRLCATIDRVRSEIEARRHVRLEEEEAGRTQARLMPRGGAAARGFACHGACRPAREVGGDFFDFFPLGPDRLALTVGDISGKGRFAGLLAAALQGRMQTLVAAGIHRPGDLVSQLNRLTVGTMEDNRFATVFFAEYDAATRILRYVSAGHPPALVLSASGEITELAATSPVIGWVPDLQAVERTVALEDHDVLIVYTDGISECTDAAGEELGTPGIVRLASAHRSSPPEAIVRMLLHDVDEFSSFAPPTDDRTLVVARVFESACGQRERPEGSEAQPSPRARGAWGWGPRRTEK